MDGSFELGCFWWFGLVLTSSWLKDLMSVQHYLVKKGKAIHSSDIFLFL